MFFKKKNAMNEKVFENSNQSNENTDKMSDQENQDSSIENELANELNVDESIPGTQHLDDSTEDENANEKINNELAEMKDKYIRLVAEFDNFRRRSAKEKMELTQTAGKEIIQSLLIVLDDSERATKQMETSTDINQVKEGIYLVFGKLKSILQSKGLKKMESINQIFDVDLHEAITEIPAPSQEMEGKIIDEVEPGYYLNEKLIRFAKVIVGK